MERDRGPDSRAELHKCNVRLETSEAAEDHPICQHVDLSSDFFEFLSRHVEQRVFFPGEACWQTVAAHAKIPGIL